MLFEVNNSYWLIYLNHVLFKHKKTSISCFLYCIQREKCYKFSYPEPLSKLKLWNTTVSALVHTSWEARKSTAKRALKCTCYVIKVDLVISLERAFMRTVHLSGVF